MEPGDTGSDEHPLAKLERPKYWQDIAASPALLAELELIRSGSKVLEIGSAGGHMTRALIDRGCRVTAIERDPESGQAAKEVCERVFIADVEDMDFATTLGAELFDVVLLGDVLEHLVHPERLLDTLHRCVAADGSLVVSLPNVAHASLRLALLQGRFVYGPWGLLDSTHLRFFTRASTREMFHRAGWLIVETRDVEIEPRNWEVKWEPHDVSVGTLRSVSRDVDAFAYQFVFRAIPESRLGTENRVSGVDAAPKRVAIHRGRRKLAQFLVRTAVVERRAGAPISRAAGLIWKAFLLSPRLKELGWLPIVSLPRAWCESFDNRRW